MPIRFLLLFLVTTLSRADKTAGPAILDFIRDARND